MSPQHTSPWRARHPAPRAAALVFFGLPMLSAGCGGDDPTPFVVTPPDTTVSLLKIDGDGQSDTVLATLAVPLRVLVLRGSEPFPDALVRWYAGASPAVDARADDRGTAALRWTLGARAGRWSTAVEAVGGDSAWVNFTATAEPGRATTLRKSSGDEQVGVVGLPLPLPYEVSAEDTYGNLAPLGSGSVVWSIAAGGGSITEACAAGCEPYLSRVEYTLGPEEGIQEVTASMAGTMVPFRARAVSAMVRIVRTCRRRGCGPARAAPDTVQVAIGKTVAWTWSGSHGLVFDDGVVVPTTEPGTVSASYLRTFDAAGTYRFRCPVHTGDFTAPESGAVVVSQ